MAKKKPQPIRVCLVSLGCPKNLVDSEIMLGQLAQGGLVVGAPMDAADVIVVNTCGFLSAARDESLEVIREALGHKASRKGVRVIVAGCLASRDGQTLYEQAPGIDAVIGVNDRDRLLSAVLAAGAVTALGPCPSTMESDSGRFRLTARHSTYLRISEGCSQKCTYCTIPDIRGPLRSKPPQAILAEARELIADGAVELNLIAQDTTSYGLDLGSPNSLASLLRSLDRLKDLCWLRLLYTYPRRFTDDLIDTLAAADHVLPYVDLPLQHISDDILRRMGRGVKRSQVEDLLTKLRSRVEGIVLRTTFIVGFPGETQQQFEELLQFVKDFRFGAMGVFEYSPEPGTPAAEMPDQIPPEVKAQRSEALMLAQQQIALEANAAMVGRPIEVLVDGADARGCCLGRYYGQAPDIDSICYLTEPHPPGAFVTGKVIDCQGYDLIVEPDED